MSLARRPAPEAPAPDPAGAPLVVEGLRHSYGERVALDGADLSAPGGRVTALVGPSGCGKTTLLRVAAGLERPLGGRVLIGAEEVAGPGRFVEPEARGVGLVFQEHALFPHLTVLGNALFGLARRPRAEALAAARRALALAGLEGREGCYPHQLSGGEAQRAALARALAPGPRLLLMDEPFASLDPERRAGVRAATLGLLREVGATALIVTHDPAEALRAGDRVALMRAGRVEQAGTPRELYQHPASLFAARFLGDLEEFEGRVVGGRVGIPFGAVPAPGLPEGARAVVGLRPAAFRPCRAGEGLAASVVSRAFLGEAEEVSVRVAGVAGPLRLRLPACGGTTGAAPLRVAARLERAMVFAA